MEKLEAEQQELKKDMKLIESSSNQARNDKACENLGELGRKKRAHHNFYVVILRSMTLPEYQCTAE